MYLQLFHAQKKNLKIYNNRQINSIEVKQSLFFIAMITVFMVSFIFIGLTFAEKNVVDVVIEKPKWCNSATLSHYYTFMEFQKEYKYPCATYI